MRRKKIVVKALVVLAGLLFLSASTAFSQDICDKYHDIYRVCVEKRDAGREVDYNVCKKSPCNDSENDCNNCGCYWRADKEACMVDICISENSGDDMVSAADYGALKKEYLRTGCPTTPNVPAAPPAPVPKTGQETSYSYYDDGYYEKGVAWPIPRFTDNGDGTVTDNLTGLIWLEDANCSIFSAPVLWSQALNDCYFMTSGDCGLTDGSYPGDWRLPNVKELQSLIDFSNYEPALPSGHPFDNVQSSNYWTGTKINADVLGGLYYVNIENGHVGSVGGIMIVYSFYVWPVRGGND